MTQRYGMEENVGKIILAVIFGTVIVMALLPIISGSPLASFKSGVMDALGIGFMEGLL